MRGSWIGSSLGEACGSGAGALASLHSCSTPWRLRRSDPTPCSVSHEAAPREEKHGHYQALYDSADAQMPHELPSIMLPQLNEALKSALCRLHVGFRAQVQFSSLPECSEMQRVDFRTLPLQHSSFRGVNVSHASFAYADLYQADFQEERHSTLLPKRTHLFLPPIAAFLPSSCPLPFSLCISLLSTRLIYSDFA